MASYLFHSGFQRALSTSDTLTTNIRAMLVMTNCTALAATTVQAGVSKQARDIDAMDEIDTLDQCDASSGYTAPGGTVSSPTFTIDTTNHWIIMDDDGSNVSFTGLDGSTRNIAGAIILKYSGAGSGNGASDYPIAFLDAADFDDSGTDVTLQFNANGIGRLQFS